MNGKERNREKLDAILDELTEKQLDLLLAFIKGLHSGE